MQVLIVHADSFVASDISECVLMRFPGAQIRIVDSLASLTNAQTPDWVPRLAVIGDPGARGGTHDYLDFLAAHHAAMVVIDGQIGAAPAPCGGWVALRSPFSDGTLAGAIASALHMSPDK